MEKRDKSTGWAILAVLPALLTFGFSEFSDGNKWPLQFGLLGLFAVVCLIFKAVIGLHERLDAITVQVDTEPGD